MFQDNASFPSQYAKKINKMYAVSHLPLALLSSTNQVLFFRPEESVISFFLPSFQKAANTYSSRKIPPNMPLILHFGNDTVAALLKLSDSCFLAVGPILIHKTNIHDFLSQYNKLQSLEELQHIYELLSQSPLMNQYHFCNLLAIIVDLFNRADLSYSDILLYNYEKEENFDEFESAVANHTLKRNYEKKDILNFERRTQYAIANGDPEALKEAFHHPARLHAKDLQFSEKTYNLVSFTAFGTLMSRTAISAGISSNDSLTLLDNYIRKVEKVRNVEEIFTLLLRLSTDYCNMVNEHRNQTGYSLLIKQCTNYIHRNLYQKITEKDLAAYSHSSTRTISRHFHNLLHISVSQYITQAKLEEAAFLLSVSDNTISEISSSLHFSSQGYFTKLFQKHFGETPHAYRCKHKT